MIENMQIPFSNMTVGLASDHAGFEYKALVREQLEKRGLKCLDFGAHSTERCDYTDYAHLLAEAIKTRAVDAGIALCGTGNGMAITLNKYPFVRAGLAWNAEIAKLIRAHNNANILVIPARFVTPDDVAQIIDACIDTPFEGGRHLERILKITPPGS